MEKEDLQKELDEIDERIDRIMKEAERPIKTRMIDLAMMTGIRCRRP